LRFAEHTTKAILLRYVTSEVIDALQQDPRYSWSPAGKGRLAHQGAETVALHPRQLISFVMSAFTGHKFQGRVSASFRESVQSLVDVFTADLQSIAPEVTLDVPYVTCYESGVSMEREFIEYNGAASAYTELLSSIEQYARATTTLSVQECARESSLVMLAIAYRALVSSAHDDLAAELRRVHMGTGDARTDEADDDDEASVLLRPLLDACKAAPRHDLASVDLEMLGKVLAAVLEPGTCDARAWATSATGAFMGQFFFQALQSGAKKGGAAKAAEGEGGGEGEGDGDGGEGEGDGAGDGDGDGDGDGAGEGEGDGAGEGASGQSPPTLYALTVELRRALARPRLVRLGRHQVAHDIQPVIQEAERRVRERERAPLYEFDDDEMSGEEGAEEGDDTVARRGFAPVRTTPRYAAGAAIPLMRRAFDALPAFLVARCEEARKAATEPGSSPGARPSVADVDAAKSEARRVWGLNLDRPLLSKTQFGNWGTVEQKWFGTTNDNIEDFKRQATFLRGGFGTAANVFSVSSGHICAAMVYTGVGWVAMPVVSATLTTRLVRNSQEREAQRTKSSTLVTQLHKLFTTGIKDNKMKTSSNHGNTALRQCYYNGDHIEIASDVNYLSSGSTALTHALQHGAHVNLFDDPKYVTVAFDTGVHQVVTGSMPGTWNPLMTADFKPVYTLHRGRLLDDGGAGRFNAAREKLYAETGLAHWRQVERTVLPHHGMDGAPVIDDLTAGESICRLRNRILLPIFKTQNSAAYQDIKRRYRERRRSAIDGAVRDFVAAVKREDKDGRQREHVLVLWGNGQFVNSKAGASYHSKFLEALLRSKDVVVLEASEYGTSKFCVHCGDAVCQAHHPKRRKRKRGGGMCSSAIRGLSVGDCCGREYSRDGDAAAAIALNVANALNAGSPLPFATPRGSMTTAKGQHAWLKHYRDEVTKRLLEAKTTLEPEDAKTISNAVNAEVKLAQGWAKKTKASAPPTTAKKARKTAAPATAAPATAAPATAAPAAAAAAPGDKALAASASAIRGLRVTAQLLTLQAQGITPMAALKPPNARRAVVATDVDDDTRRALHSQASRSRGNA